MKQLDEAKLSALKTMDELLDGKYGKPGTESRKEFHERAMAWYHEDILKGGRRERHNLIQPQFGPSSGH
jgi:hypothetical protein